MTKDFLTDKVIGLTIEVHRTLGPGLLETVYESCLCQELSAADISFQRQIPIPVSYKGQQLAAGFRADVVVQAELLLEIKSVEKLAAPAREDWSLWNGVLVLSDRGSRPTRPRHVAPERQLTAS